MRLSHSLLLIGLIAAPDGNAVDKVTYPNVSGEVDFEMWYERLRGSSERDSGERTLKFGVGAELLLRFPRQTQVTAELAFEEVDGQGLDLGGRSFGVQVDTLTLGYEHERLAVYAGKFNPNFSIAHDAAPGLYGDDLPDDEIALDDSVGVGGSVSLGPTPAGALRISGSVFQLDRTVFSKPFFSEEERARLNEDGPGNSDSFESYALALDGEDISRSPGLRYHLGWTRLDVEEGEAEHRLAAGAEWRIETEHRSVYSTLGEIVHFLSAEGDPAANRTYVTGSLLYELEGVSGAVVFTSRNVAGGGEEGSTFDYQISLGYEFQNGVSLEAGYKRTREVGVNRSEVGAKVVWTLEL